MVQFSATRCSCIAILWVSLLSFAAITLCVASQQVFIVVSVYFVIDSVRKLLNTHSYSMNPGLLSAILTVQALQTMWKLHFMEVHECFLTSLSAFTFHNHAATSSNITVHTLSNRLSVVKHSKNKTKNVQKCDSYESVSKSFRTESITKYMLTFGIARWEATQRVMAAKLTRLIHKIAIQLHLVAETISFAVLAPGGQSGNFLIRPLITYCTN
jgi:hypothetical protein